MKQFIKDRWDDKKLGELAKRFGTTPKDLTILDGFESFIYEYEREGKGYILRITHSSRRDKNLIHGEVDWINYLAKGGARVAQAIESDTGNLIEMLADGHGDAFLATAFVKAQGKRLSHEEWTPEFLAHYGETIGRIHRLSRNYTVSNPAWQRYRWDDEEVLSLKEWAQVIEPTIIERAQTIIKRLQQIPPDETFHIIHQDAHGGNFFVDDNGQITLFDFDDCLYGYEVDDIAMVLFYSSIRDKPEQTEQFTTDFLKGYCRENTFDPKWLAHIVDFMTLREIDLYALIERDIDWRNGEEPWAIRYMQGRQERLLNETPLVDFDFMTLAHILES